MYVVYVVYIYVHKDLIRNTMQNVKSGTTITKGLQKTKINFKMTHLY